MPLSGAQRADTTFRALFIVFSMEIQGDPHPSLMQKVSLRTPQTQMQEHRRHNLFIFLHLCVVSVDSDSISGWHGGAAVSHGETVADAVSEVSVHLAPPRGVLP